MNRRRPILFWPLAVVAVCATGWWAFHIPYAPRKIYSAIPVQASFVSAHRNLAGRWDEVSANPLTQALFADANMNAKDWRDLNADPQFRDWLSRLASDEFVLAYVPELADGKSGWVFASWLGGRSQRLRMALQMSNIPGITYAGTRRGWPVWVASSRMFKGGEDLAFSIVEGMIVGSYSGTPNGIETVLACVDGRYPSLALKRDGDAITPPDPADRGWYRIPDATRGFFDAPRLHFSFSDFASNRLAGKIRAPFALLDGAPPLPAVAPPEVANWQTDLPASVLIMPSAPARRWLLQAGTDALTRAFAGLICEQADGPLYASLFGGDYRGLFLAMKFPAILVAAASTNAGQLPAQLAGHLAEVNSEFRWALSPDEASAGPARLWMIRATNDSIYAQSERGEQIGLAAGTNWVLAASSAHALTNILRDAILRESRPVRLALAARSASQHNAAAYAWINLPQSCPAVRMGVGQYILRLRIENTPQSQARRRQLNETVSWLYGLQPLGNIELWARPLNGSTEIEFQTAPAVP